LLRGLKKGEVCFITDLIVTEMQHGGISSDFKYAAIGVLESARIRA